MRGSAARTQHTDHDRTAMRQLPDPAPALGRDAKGDTVTVPTHDFRGGVGEPTTCAVTPCLPKAIHVATGKPVRSLPLEDVKLV